jgi:hypothetical protein
MYCNWAETAGDGAVADEGALVHGGTHAAKLTAGANRTTLIRISSYVVNGAVTGRPGSVYTLSFWTRGDGVNAGRYSVYDNTNAADIKASTSTGVTGADYTQVTYTLRSAGCYTILVDLKCPNVNRDRIF